MTILTYLFQNVKKQIQSGESEGAHNRATSLRLAGMCEESITKAAKLVSLPKELQNIIC